MDKNSATKTRRHEEKISDTDQNISRKGAKTQRKEKEALCKDADERRFSQIISNYSEP
jgi:hypothetical protein